MSRYFVQRRRVKADWDGGYTEAVAEYIPTVCDHEPVDTGLIDVNGDAIMRAPNPIGFIWSDD